MSGQKYEEEVMRELMDSSTYSKLTENPFPRIVQTLNEKLMFASANNLISKKELHYLTVLEFNTPIFYIIPKLHKSLINPPGRPIVSAIKGPLERIGRYTDALIKELVSDLPSFVRDTRDVLRVIREVVSPVGALLVGIDVESLYTSIPHEWGLRAVGHFLEKSYPLLAAQNEFILELLESMLTNNCFQFLGSYLQQRRGTSMGAPWAPSFACLHLGLWEEEVIYSSPLYLGHSKLWLRYIDDIFMIWGGTPHQLNTFMQELNINDRNLRFTYTYHPNTISFLDLDISIQADRLVTKIFCKKTAANTLLQASSHHPQTLIQVIQSGQFLRIRWNCSSDADFREEASELYTRFRERGYSHRSICGKK